MYIIIDFYIYECQLKCSKADQDTLKEHEQYALIFNIAHLAVYTFLQVVLQCVNPSDKKNSRVDLTYS